MGRNNMPLSELWDKKWGVAFCMQVMSRDRFKEILRFLRFDKKSTLSQRLQTDKFALFSTVWNRFIENSVACYKPGGFLTVDEQLFPSKARCPFTQFMASKPDKYGQKYWLAVDKDSKYVVNGFPYVGKAECRSTDERVSDHVVMKLAEPYLKKGRNITTDNYFTSVKLAKLLKSKNTSLLGTLNKMRRKVPSELKNMRDQQFATKLYKSDDDVLLSVYQGKRKKNVLLLSTLLADATIADNQKKTPETVKCYNDTKYGVDVVDQMARKYTVRTMTRRWPIHSFQNTLDLAAINAWILYKEINGIKISRRRFLQNLSEDLALPRAKSSTLTRTTEDIAACSSSHQQETVKSKINAKRTALLVDATNVKNFFVGNALPVHNVFATAATKNFYA